MTKLIVDVFRCKKMAGAYIYVEKGFDTSDLPELLVEKAGTFELAMSFLLTESKSLARADAKSVIESIQSQSFYLQMPDLTEVEYPFIDSKTDSE